LRKIKFLKIFKIEKYITSTLLKNFFVSSIFFLGIYLFSNILAELPSLLKRADYNEYITFNNIMRYYILKIPEYFFTVVPFAFLFATSYTLGRFYRNNEIIAFISSGLSITRITFAVVIIAFILSVALMFLNFNIIPNYNYNSALVEEKLYRKVRIEDEDRIQSYGDNGINYFARIFNSREKVFIGILILKSSEQSLDVRNISRIKVEDIESLSIDEQIKKITAQVEYSFSNSFPYLWGIKASKMKWDDSSEKWIATDGIYWEWDNNGNIIKIEQFDVKILENINEKPSFFAKDTKNIKEMTIKECFDHIEKLKKSKQPYKKDLVEVYSEKYSKPFSIFILALLATSIGKAFSRKNLLIMTLLISFLIALVYYLLINIGISIGKEGILPPLLASFSGNLLSIIIFFYLRHKQLT